ncbi:DUF2971 domain-containing protein [Salmonella enterica]|uniref:DUF2971 domain-containing protein n=1 Tax=Klebsiella aerogenes TaxID=548 RepID=UPI001277EB8C|nr:DUF2971 domain-containing protein [Klebsiella aerogenes]ECF7019542.1 DUF2971 domain-containing protein [Salmonella enterica subsp. arizonae]EFP4455524.1 DUF2971 domain-containing protein [Salmonella enterica]ECI8172271.1 DUF2971 domain-containing protein [Salmonella enterica subsp. arizonae]EED9355019.1 DUF2971 domain-containing protein [Salmonella enterica subsp. arizonae]EHC2801815.1 DUF2971 domain-containing protein [Salmonella enterica]
MLFKYCPVSDYSLNSLENNTLYLNHLCMMNDSAEGFCRVENGFPKYNERGPRYEKIIKAWYGESGGNPSEYEYGEYIDSMREIEPSVPDLLDSARISCFTSTALNPTMWAHYAKGMTGICIEFDEEKFKGLEDMHIFDVNYLDHPPTVDTAVLTLIGDQIDYNNDALFKGYTDGFEHLYEQAFDECQGILFEIFNGILATKSTEWSYEKEKRLIYQLSFSKEDIEAKNKKSGINIRLPEYCIKNVILGEKTTSVDKGLIISAIERSGRHIGLKRVVRRPNEYALSLIDVCN